MKKFYLAAIAVIVIIALLLWVMFIPESDAQNVSTQGFNPSRFAIINAVVNVNSPEMGGLDNTQTVLVKIDTATGRAWILQMDVAGGNSPRLRSSSWHEVGIKMQRMQ